VAPEGRRLPQRPFWGNRISESLLLSLRSLIRRFYFDAATGRWLLEDSEEAIQQHDSRHESKKTSGTQERRKPPQPRDSSGPMAVSQKRLTQPGSHWQRPHSLLSLSSPQRARTDDTGSNRRARAGARDPSRPSRLSSSATAHLLLLLLCWWRSKLPLTRRLEGQRPRGGRLGGTVLLLKSAQLSAREKSWQ
jgi:hypothetical protein